MTIILSFYLWCVGGAYTETFPRPFDSAAWKKPADYQRCGMLLDLQYRVGVDGRTQRDLSALLGEPDYSDGDPTKSHWYLCPSFLDTWVLEVNWLNGRVASSTVHDT